MTPEVNIIEIAPGVHIALRSLGQGEPDVRAALLFGTGRAMVIDTLARPEDMAPLQAMIADHGAPVVVVNTHADWDHAWGNAAFAGAPIIAHRSCRTRLQGEREREVLRRKKAEDGVFYANVTLEPPNIVFDQTLTVDLGGLTVELHHLPGHQPDCLVAYVPERKLLYAGDCAEDPLPLLNSGPLDAWIAGLRAWAERDVQTVVPSHGAISGVELLRSNADYLAGLEGGAAPASAPGFYAEAHRENVVAARRMREASGQVS